MILRDKKLTGLTLFILICFLLPAVLAPWLAPFSPEEMDLVAQLEGPTVRHWLGMDQNGSDILSRMLYGARISLYVGFWVVGISSLVGISIGLISGYYGGWLDSIIMRIVDILMAFPGLLLAIALVAVMGPDINNVVFALTVLGWVSYTRLVRGQVLSVKEEEYILAAKTSGISDFRVMFRHILPNILHPVIVQTTFSLAGTIISESSLSFLGLGVPPGTPSWGSMLADGKDYLLEAPHVSIFPGIAIMLVVLAFNLLGDALRDYYDPQLHK
ncbi:MAG: ABC transporter permease [SAR324 cluster bacterium]|nr:ABC transporter permease [SAR324 cluster bacterium]